MPHLVDNNVNFNIIINPRKGDLVGQHKQIIELCSSKLEKYANYQIAIIIDSKTELKIICQLLLKSKCTNRISLIHNRYNNNIEKVLSFLKKDFSIVNNIINTNNIRERYFTNFDLTSIVTLKDSFMLQEKNSDYLKIDESEFSEEHLHFTKENIKGYSDFLTIGDKFVNSGFSPYAVAIHISYIRDNKIRIKHFVSDSNFDNTNTAGKYYEALNKLIEWENNNNLNTIAMRQFKEYHTKQHFPNLGILKKLSIMNHLEIVNRLI